MVITVALSITSLNRMRNKSENRKQNIETESKMKEARMMKINQAMVDIEALTTGRPAPTIPLIRVGAHIIWMPIRFLVEGCKLLLRQTMLWSLLTFAVMCLMLLVWPNYLEIFEISNRDGAFLFKNVFIGLTVLCGLVAFFSVPSRHVTYEIDDELLEKTLGVFEVSGLDEHQHLRATLIECVEQTTKSRVRTWLTLAAILWGIYLFSLRGLDQYAPVENIYELTVLLLVVVFIWLIASAYSAASKKLIYLLKFADSVILDRGTKTTD